jgi:hypothetical protein
MTLNELADLVRQVAAGDLRAFERLLALDPPEIWDLSKTDFTLEITAEAVLRVLRALKEKTFPEDLIQHWATFMLVGAYRSNSTQGRPWNMYKEYVEPRGDEICDAIHRLEELGEPYDGVISDKEIDEMIRLLSPPAGE